MLRSVFALLFALVSPVAFAKSPVKSGIEKEWQIILPDRQVFALKKEHYKDIRFYSVSFRRGLNELKNRTIEDKKGAAILKNWSKLYLESQKSPNCNHPIEIRMIEDFDNKISYLCLQSAKEGVKTELRKYLKDLERSVL